MQIVQVLLKYGELELLDRRKHLRKFSVNFGFAKALFVLEPQSLGGPFCWVH